MNFLLQIDFNKPLEFNEILSWGGTNFLLGMAAVFSVLIIIWLSLVVLKFFLYDIPERRKANAQDSAVDETVTETVQSTNNDEIVAVIAAAIAAAESESSGLKFKVVSFRRK